MHSWEHHGKCEEHRAQCDSNSTFTLTNLPLKPLQNKATYKLASLWIVDGSFLEAFRFSVSLVFAHSPSLGRTA